MLLAFGRRGTPRKLDVAIPDAMLDHVHYSLADARSFAGAACSWSGSATSRWRPRSASRIRPTPGVTISYRGADFTRGKRRNIDELRRLIQAGRVEMCWCTEVAAVEPGGVVLRGAGGHG